MLKSFLLSFLTSASKNADFFFTKYEPATYLLVLSQIDSDYAGKSVCIWDMLLLYLDHSNDLQRFNTFVIFPLRPSVIDLAR